MEYFAPTFAGAISGLFSKGISFDLALSRPSPPRGIEGGYITTLSLAWDSTLVLSVVVSLLQLALFMFRKRLKKICIY
jgi:hypothetical protein